MATKKITEKATTATKEDFVEFKAKVKGKETFWNKAKVFFEANRFILGYGLGITTISLLWYAMSLLGD